MRLLRYAVLSILLLIVSSVAYSFEIPALKAHVNDYAGVLNEQTSSSIKNASAALEKKEGTQVVVLTIKDMGDAADIKEYANKVFVAWGLGQKGVDNGVLIVLALKERMVRIEVGKGLEEHLTDAGSAQIIRAARPSLSKGDYNSGLLQISQEVQNTISGKFAPSPAVVQQPAQPYKSAPWVEKTAAVVNTIFFSALGLSIIWVFWTHSREPKKSKQKVDDENQSSPSSGTTRVVKTWGPDEFKKTDSNRASTKRNRAAMGIATAAAATAIATSNKRRSDETHQESSWSPSYDSSSSSSSSDCCSGGGGDSGGGGSDSSF